MNKLLYLLIALMAGAQLQAMEKPAVIVAVPQEATKENYLQAAFFGDLEKVQAFIQWYPKFISVTGQGNFSALHAVVNGFFNLERKGTQHFEIFELLLNAKIDTSLEAMLQDEIVTAGDMISKLMQELAAIDSKNDVYWMQEALKWLKLLKSKTESREVSEDVRTLPIERIERENVEEFDAATQEKIDFETAQMISTFETLGAGYIAPEAQAAMRKEIEGRYRSTSPKFERRDEFAIQRQEIVQDMEMEIATTLSRYANEWRYLSAREKEERSAEISREIQYKYGKRYPEIFGDSGRVLEFEPSSEEFEEKRHQQGARRQLNFDREEGSVTAESVRSEIDEEIAKRQAAIRAADEELAAINAKIEQNKVRRKEEKARKEKEIAQKKERTKKVNHKNNGQQ